MLLFLGEEPDVSLKDTVLEPAVLSDESVLPSCM